MRRVIFEEKGGPEVLKFDGTTDAEEAITWMAYLNAYNLLTAPRVEPDLPSPATGEVRIKIKAIGLNRYESMFRQGVFWSRATRDLLESFRDVSVRPSTTPPAAPEEAQPHFPSPWNRPLRGGGLVRTPKSGRYLPKNVRGDGWTPAWIAFAELRMPFVVSSVLKRSIATSSIITSAAAMPPADHALRSVRAAA
jgi:hypothetical protein